MGLMGKKRKKHNFCYLELAFDGVGSLEVLWSFDSEVAKLLQQQ
jgi:hypothetical protein